MALPPDTRRPFNVVQIDGLVLLKIINHCRDHMPEVVTGQLLGLDIEGRLEVTNCFPIPLSSHPEDDTDAYQIEMMKQLRAVNVDNNTVGWYQSAYLGTFLSQSMVEAQYQYQKQIAASVLLVYDPAQTTKGRLALKAFRLTDSFMTYYEKSKQHNQQNTIKGDEGWGEVFEELPIKVHNSHLIHAFLYELRENNSMNCDYDRLSVSSQVVLEKHLSSISTALDDYANEQGRFQFYQRLVGRVKAQQATYLAKRASDQEAREAAGKDPLPEEDLTKNPLWKPVPKPSRLESVLLSNQIEHYTKEVESNTTQGFNKLYIVKSLHSNSV